MLKETEEKIKKLQEGLHVLLVKKSLEDLIIADEYILKNRNLFPMEVMSNFINTDVKNHFKFNKEQLLSLIGSFEKSFYQKSNENVETNDKFSVLSEITNAKITEEISVGQDYCNKQLIYGLNLNNNNFLITSNHDVCKLSEVEKVIGLKPKYMNVEISKIHPKTIDKFVKKEVEQMRLTGLFMYIKDYYKSYMYFDDSRSFDVITIWTMLTYIYKAFRYCPYIWLNADKGSGKSRLLELAQDLCFNAMMSASTTPASIFRYIDCSNATLLIDEVEDVMNDKNAELRAILNSGFQAEGRVSRTKTDDKSFKLQNFSSYSPKILAGINDLPDVLKDRCVRVRLLKKPKDITVQRYKRDDVLKKRIFEIVQGLYMFGLLYCNNIKEIYDDNKIEFSSCLSDRDKDIWEPMLCIAKFIDESIDNDLEYKIEEVLKVYSEEKSKERAKADMEDNQSYRLLRDLNTMLAENKIISLLKNGFNLYNNENLLGYLNDDCEHSFSSVSHLTKTLNSKFNIQTERFVIDGKKQKFYALNSDIINDLMSRYNIAEVQDQ